MLPFLLVFASHHLLAKPAVEEQEQQNKDFALVRVPLVCEGCQDILTCCPHLTPKWLRWFTWQVCDSCGNHICSHRVARLPRWKRSDRVDKDSSLFAHLKRDPSTL